MPPLLRGLLMTSLLASGPSAGADDSLLLVDFSGSMQCLRWRVVNDGVMGGRSDGGFRLEERSLLFTGKTNTDGGGFSSTRSEARPFDLGEYDGIRLRVRGDGRTYTFRLTTWDTRDERFRPSYWAEFETRGDEWEVIDVSFRRFRPRWRGRWLEGPALNPQAIDGLGLMIYDKRDGPFRLEVDWIRAYREPRPFSMSTYRWQKRPLLLFAEDEGDARLRRQLSDVEATRDRFDERDMVLIVILSAGTSRAEERALTTDAADHLRTSNGVDGSTFALRLVGKDGGVKLQSRDVVPMEALYDLIDAMPMRREEMRQR
jgi:monofunctional biosynthetic peptidoglycan transglycosylase